MKKSNGPPNGRRPRQPQIPDSAPYMNAWKCEKCEKPTVCVDVAIGVTPFMIRCEHCRDANAQSMFYKLRGIPLEKCTHEWYRPNDHEIGHLAPGSLRHVTQGGLLLRQRSDVPPVTHGDMREQTRLREGGDGVAQAEDLVRTIDKRQYRTATNTQLQMHLQECEREVRMDDEIKTREIVELLQAMGKTMFENERLGAIDICSRRWETLTREGWSPEFEDSLDPHDFLVAAMYHLRVAADQVGGRYDPEVVRGGWPWPEDVLPCEEQEDPEQNMAVAGAFLATSIDMLAAKAKQRVCRECGCTDDDCRHCIEESGEPCSWVEDKGDDSLCSRCAGKGEGNG